MRENCLSYSDVIDYFGETKIADRYKYLYDHMQEYIKARNLEEKLSVHEGILQQVIMDYFVDIYRLKEFHKIDNVDMPKILAYEAYWILRRKPLQIASGELNSRLVFANEGFVTTLFAHEFLLPDAREPMNPDEEETLLEYLRHLNYHLKYRAVDKQALELMLYAYRTGQNRRV